MCDYRWLMGVSVVYVLVRCFFSLRVVCCSPLVRIYQSLCHSLDKFSRFRRVLHRMAGLVVASNFVGIEFNLKWSVFGWEYDVVLVDDLLLNLEWRVVVESFRGPSWTVWVCILLLCVSAIALRNDNTCTFLLRAPCHAELIRFSHEVWQIIIVHLISDRLLVLVGVLPDHLGNAEGHKGRWMAPMLLHYSLVDYGFQRMRNRLLIELNHSWSGMNITSCNLACC